MLAADKAPTTSETLAKNVSQAAITSAVALAVSMLETYRDENDARSLLPTRLVSLIYTQYFTISILDF